MISARHSAAWTSSPVRADEAAILADLKAFLRTDNRQRHQELATRIQADSTYDHAKVREWLHQADLFELLPPGRHEITVALPDGRQRSVVFRIPADYDPQQPYPLIYALHGATSNGDQIAGFVARLLGDQVNKYVIAAPTAYEELIIHHKHWPPMAECPALLLAIKQTVHVDSDRVYVTGYSMGGHTTWTVAVLHSDQFAAALPMAGNFALLTADELWSEFIMNLQHIPLTSVWGAGDIQWADGRVGPDRGIAGNNQRFRDLAANYDIPYRGIELPDVGHRGVLPPPDAWRDFLSHTRVQSPLVFEHTFRHIYQANAYWVEAHSWVGDQWTDQRRTGKLEVGESMSDDEALDQAAARMFRSLLGRIEGRRDGNTLEVRRRKVKELTVWIHHAMIDWDRPVILKANGREVFNDRLEPDLYVCLSQAARTWDFDRLRWAGLRFKSGSKTRPVTAETEFPTLAELLGADEQGHR